MCISYVSEKHDMSWGANLVGTRAHYERVGAAAVKLRQRVLQLVLGRVGIYVHVDTINRCANGRKRSVQILVGVELDELVLGDADF